MLLPVVAEVRERQDHDRQPRRSDGGPRDRGGGWNRGTCQFGGAVANPVDPHRPGNVLHLLLTEVVKGEIDFVAHLIADNPADANSTRLCQGFQPRRHIHAITKDIVALSNHVAQVDPHTELDPPLRRGVRVALGHPPLHLDGAADGIHDARELGKKAVAGGLYDAASVLGDLGVDQFPKVGLEPFVCPLLIRAHQPGIAGHIGGEDRGETADRGHIAPGGRWA